MVELIGNTLWGLLLAALGVAFIIGARALAELGRGIGYPPTHYRTRSNQERPIGWWTLLPFRAFGFPLVCAGLAVFIWTLWRFDAIDDCLDAGGRWIESEQTCRGARVSALGESGKADLKNQVPFLAPHPCANLLP